MSNSNCYLPSRNDDTDMTEAIEEKLSQYGMCQLGKGVYVVSGIRMPEGSSLIGVGFASRLLLKEDVERGYTVQTNSYCTVRDLSVTGSLEAIDAPQELGDRHGIAFLGTATKADYSGQPHNVVVHGCFISGFSGGGITCVDTGFSSRCVMSASDCHILDCGAGINIAHFSEYHMFTNIMCQRCLYGCINNGGNNVFTNCGFNSNRVGFLIDNAQKQSINNSHGSAVGCTFNHSGGNGGIGIQILGAKSGYSFTGCQLFFSHIVLENSDDIVFVGLNTGRQVQIHIKGGGLTMFGNCSFGTPPEAICVVDNPLVHFSNCFTRDGKPVGSEYRLQD